MADISTAPITRRINPPRLSFARLRIWSLLAAIPASLGDAFSMAFVDPYTNVYRELRVTPDDDLEGRDPDW